MFVLCLRLQWWMRQRQTQDLFFFSAVGEKQGLMKGMGGPRKVQAEQRRLLVDARELLKTFYSFSVVFAFSFAERFWAKRLWRLWTPRRPVWGASFVWISQTPVSCVRAVALASSGEPNARQRSKGTQSSRGHLYKTFEEARRKG